MKILPSRLLILLTLPLTFSLHAATPPSDIVGKITVGYQGWFSAKGDGSPVNNWGHQNLEMWPDLSEYKTTYQVLNLKMPDGKPARMFSSYDDQVVQTHFKWMAESGIDCAALQRFCNELKPGSRIKAQRDGMAEKVMKAAELSNLKFYIMYDSSGWGVRGIKEDWKDTLIDKLHITSSKAYARQNGKPVICIYGFGYKRWPATPAQAMDIINFFKQQGYYVIGSVPGAWRTNNGDSQPDFADVYTSFDMISAWGVGRIMDKNYARWINGDAAYCKAHNVDYQPCLYPGTSFYNSNHSKQNLIPRKHGDFMWAQFVTVRQAGVQTAYIAMFDELNEATSIFKCAPTQADQPAGKWFLPLDADGQRVSSDFYLRLTRDGGKMLKNLTPLQEKCPTPFTLTDK
jgi:hypothetical protein